VLIEIDFKSIDTIYFDNLKMYMLILMLKKFLNVFKLYYEPFDLKTLMGVGCLNWNLNESCLEIMNIYIYIYIYIYIFLCVFVDIEV